MNQSIESDIVIIGAGIVGCALAGLLAEQTPLKITLIEQKLLEKTNSSDNYDARVSALSVASENMFKQIDAWDAVLKDRASAFKKMFVWDRNTQAHIQFNALDVSALHLGHLVENSVLLNALIKKIKAQTNITILEEMPESILGNQIQFKNGTSLSAKLIIGADGAKSWTREQAGIEWQTKDYHHTAIVCSLTTEKSHEQTAWQCFTPEGPIAFLPFENEHHCSLVWSSSPEHAASLMLMTDEQFQEALAKNFEYKLGKVLKVSARHAFPLTRAEAKTFVKDNIILMGDAAHTIHPLAGQGLNLGLSDAISLAQLITEALAGGKPWDAPSLLKRYERSRKSDTFLMMQTMDQLKNLFAAKHPVIQGIRQLGLNAVNKSPFIKNQLAKRAMGILPSSR